MPDGPGHDTKSALPDVAAPADAAAPAPDASRPAGLKGYPSAREPAVAAPDAPTAGAEQSSLAAPAPAPRGLSYVVDIVFCIDVTGSMDPIIDAVKANALTPGTVRERRRRHGSSDRVSDTDTPTEPPGSEWKEQPAAGEATCASMQVVSRWDSRSRDAE